MRLFLLLLGYVISFMMYTHQRTDGNLYQQPMHAWQFNSTTAMRKSVTRTVVAQWSHTVDI